MSAGSPSTQVLFDAWRRGDAQAGQQMAQRFTDWFFAIAAIHSGESQGRQGFQAACDRFSQGVAAVPDPKRLGPWAQNVAKELIHAGRPRLEDGDFTGTYTAQRTPKDLLAAARLQMPSDIALLDAAYRGGEIDDPGSVLEARYRVKQWLQQQGMPFRIVPPKADPDLNPLPFYEAGQMGQPTEYVGFELFMLEEPDLVQDVAEFAHFAIALRGGIEAGAPPPTTGHAPKPKATVTPGATRKTSLPAEASPREPVQAGPPKPAASEGGTDMAKMVPILIGAVVVLIILVVILAVVALG